LLVHALAFAHAAPFDCFFVHAPLLQNASAAQSVSSVQRVVHVPPVHKYGSQSVPVVLFTQLPLPLQICPVTIVPMHMLEPHDTPAGVLAIPAHVVASTPSHAGSEHAPPPAGHAVRDPCGCPVTATHCPCLPETSHAWH
jgi:hypothetical protein